MGDELLKNGSSFGKDYFDQLLERIREIRSPSEEYMGSEFLQHHMIIILAEVTLDFFKNVQSKLHYAVSGLIPPEIIKSRARVKKNIWD